jgi:hypothetical protein
MTKKEIKDVVEMLEQGPILIRMAKEMIANLPKSPARNELIKNLLSVRKSLIQLDVCLEDIEWSIAQCQVLEIEKNEKNQESPT